MEGFDGPYWVPGIKLESFASKESTFHTKVSLAPELSFMFEDQMCGKGLLSLLVALVWFGGYIQWSSDLTPGSA